MKISKLGDMNQMRALPQPPGLLKSITPITKPNVVNETLSTKGNKRYILPTPGDTVVYHPISALEPLLNNVKEERMSVANSNDY